MLKFVKARRGLDWSGVERRCDVANKATDAGERHQSRSAWLHAGQCPALDGGIGQDTAHEAKRGVHHAAPGQVARHRVHQAALQVQQWERQPQPLCHTSASTHYHSSASPHAAALPKLTTPPPHPPALRVMQGDRVSWQPPRVARGGAALVCGSAPQSDVAVGTEHRLPMPTGESINNQGKCMP